MDEATKAQINKLLADSTSSFLEARIGLQEISKKIETGQLSLKDALILLNKPTPEPDPDPLPETWPAAPISVIQGSQFTTSPGQIIENRILRFIAPEAQQSVLYAPVALLVLINVILDANGRVQGSFASEKVNAKFVKFINPRPGWGHRAYWRQGKWEHVYILGDASRGSNQFDFHAYGQNVRGNIDVEFHDLMSESSWPSIFGGAATCPVEQWAGDGFTKPKGTLILGGLGGGTPRVHKDVNAVGLRVNNLEVNYQYEPGCGVEGEYTGTLVDRSGGTLDVSKMKKVASFTRML